MWKYIVMTMTSFAISLWGQCCRRHVVGQRIVSDISVARSCCSKYVHVVCVLNLIMLICCYEAYTPVRCCTWNVYLILLASHTKRNLTYNMTVCSWWQRIQWRHCTLICKQQRAKTFLWSSKLDQYDTVLRNVFNCRRNLTSPMCGTVSVTINESKFLFEYIVQLVYATWTAFTNLWYFVLEQSG